MELGGGNGDEVDDETTGVFATLGALAGVGL